ncbi:MAG: hypothetical protein JST54_34035 [Deltaproteobacteria bacterium]|nr:hypothetical protein [Deltaproteobacteria bacterium]
MSLGQLGRCVVAQVEVRLDAQLRRALAVLPDRRPRITDGGQAIEVQSAVEPTKTIVVADIELAAVGLPLLHQVGNGAVGAVDHGANLDLAKPGIRCAIQRSDHSKSSSEAIE